MYLQKTNSHQNQAVGTNTTGENLVEISLK